MCCSNLKILSCLLIALMMLFAPPALEFIPGGESYAMGNWFSQDRANNSFHRAKVATKPKQNPTIDPFSEPSPATNPFESNPAIKPFCEPDPTKGPSYGSGPAIQPLSSETPPPAAVPEPATLLLFGCGAAGLAALKRKFKKNK